MKRILSIVSALALTGTVLPSILFLAGQMSLPTVKTMMLICAIAWFVTTPFWMERQLEE